MARDWLIECRRNAGLTQDEVAKKADISQQALAAIELGNRNPSIETAKKIATTLGFDWPLFYPDEIEKQAM